jgi:hypothetical protein
MNIVELAANGRVKWRWCFAPEGAPATGDVMLAQKIALETFEMDALAIARRGAGRRVSGPVFFAYRQACLARPGIRRFATLVWSFFKTVI